MRKRKKRLFLLSLLAMVFLAFFVPGIALASDIEVSTYEELKKAITESNEVSVKLTKEIDMGTNTMDSKENLFIGGEKNVTIDLAGNTLKGGAQYVIRTDAGSTLTIKDSSDPQKGVITSTYAKGGRTLNVDGTLNLQGGTITSNPSATSTAYAVYLNKNGNLEMSGGTIQAAGQKTKYSLYMGSSIMKSTIANGNILAENVSKAYGLSGGAAGTLEIQSGTFSFDPTPYCGAGKIGKESGGTYSIEDISSDEQVVAKIGEDKYASFMSALANAKENDTVVIIKSFAENASSVVSANNVTLDLNGYNVEIAKGYYLTINEDAGLTISGGSQSTGKLTVDQPQVIKVYGSLQMNSGTVDNGSTYAAFVVQPTGNFIMNGGEIIGVPAVYAYGGAVTLNAGKLTKGEGGNAIYGSLYLNSKNSELVIGTVEGTHDDLIIDRFGVGSNTPSNVTYNSGTIGSVAGTLPIAEGTTVGCIFKELTENNLPGGYGQGGYEGQYTVVKITEENAVAKIDDTLYVSASVAASSLQNGETLVLLDDVTGSSGTSLLTIKAYNAKIDLNGHSVTNTHPNGIGITMGAAFPVPGQYEEGFNEFIENNGANPSAINAATPVEFSSPSSNTPVTANIGENINLNSTSNVTVKLGNGARLLYSEEAAKLVGNGGFRGTNSGVSYIYNTAAEAVKYDDTNTAVLLNDYTGSNGIVISSSATIDLNGHTFTTSNKNGINVVMSNINATVKNGTVVSSASSTLTEEDTPVSGLSVVTYSSGFETTTYENIDLVLENLNIQMQNNGYGIVVNGMNDDINITLKNGSSVSTNDDGIAIYFPPQSGKLLIEDSSVTGGTGIAIKGGELTVSGDSVIRGTGKASTPSEPENSGVNFTGDAIYLEDNYTTSRNALVEVKGGNIISDNGKPVQMLSKVGSTTFKKGIIVFAGNFSDSVPEEYLDSSLTTEYYSAQNTAAPYSYFGSTDEAVKNLQPGDKVTSLKENTGTATNKTVTISYGNGSADTVLNLPAGTTFKLPATPSRNGYTFSGWTDGTNTYEAGYERSIGDAEKYTAIWTAVPSSPAPDVNYPVTIPNDLDNGSITIPQQDKWATDGEKITITVTPDAGYMLDDLTITDGNGNKITYTDNGDGTYTFTMPGSGVNIDATFVVDPDYEEPSDEPTEPEAPTDVADIFIDVEAGAWYENAIQFCVDRGIMTGTSDTTFEPQTPTTRGMIVSILHRLEGAPAASGNDFSDVNDGEWYSDPVSWAAANGIVGGYTDGTFQPNRVITREEMASILYRYCEYKGIDVSARTDLDRYTDSPSEWAAEVMSWANAEGLINGRTATTIDAKDSTTRAECAAIFQRYVQNVVK